MFSKYLFQHLQEQVSNRESRSTSANNRMEESEPQRCFKNGVAALLTESEDALSPCYRNRSRHAEAQSGRRLSHQERQTLPPNSWNQSTMGAIASQLKLSSPRYVEHVAFVFGIGRSVMNDIRCCKTDSEPPTTKGIESNDTASSSVLGVILGGNRRRNFQFGQIRDRRYI